MPALYCSPSPRTCGRIDICAALNGPAARLSTATHAHNAGSGKPGIAIATASAARARSATAITQRRGYRSASPDRRIPPSREGMSVSP